jgi:hypothetical protein
MEMLRQEKDELALGVLTWITFEEVEHGGHSQTKAIAG